MVIASTMSHEDEIKLITDELLKMSKQVMELHDLYNTSGHPRPDFTRRLRKVLGYNPVHRCSTCLLKFYEINDDGECDHCYWRHKSKHGE